MFKKAKIELFWFLKRDAMLNLDEAGTKQMYIQQVMTHGRDADVKEMLRDLGVDTVYSVFQNIKRFVPKEVRMFWEDFFASHYRIPGKSS